MESGPSTFVPRIEAGPPIRLEPIAGPALDIINIRNVERASIGKDHRNDVVLEHPAVSRSHAVLEAIAGQWLIVDSGSRNGTFVNARRLSPMGPVPLSHGDHVRIPPWVFRVHLAATEESAITIDDRIANSRRLSILTGRDRAASQPSVGRILEAAAAIHAAQDVDALWSAVIDAVLSLTGFQQVAVIGRTSSTDRVEVLRSEVRDHGQTRFEFSRSLVESAMAGNIVHLRAPAQAASSSVGLLEISSAACVPLVLDSAVWGCLYMDARGGANESPQGPATLVHADIVSDLCQTIASIASLALANVLKRGVEARLANLQRDAELAAQAQRLLLPPERGTVEGLRYAIGFKPGRIVSGDLVGVVGLGPGRTAAFLGDVTGKGLGAGVVMAAIQSYLTASLARAASTSAAVDELNRHIAERLPPGCYASLWVAVFDSNKRTVDVVDAGHGLAFLAEGGQVRALGGQRGLWVGVESGRKYQSEVIHLREDARIVVISDGLVEQPGLSGQQFGLDRIRDAIAASSSVEDDVSRLMDAVATFAGTSAARDDLTVASFAF